MRRYLIHFFIVVLPVLIFSLLLAWRFEPIDGDLTRTGNWAERDFGPNTDLGALKINVNSQNAPYKDVLVLGDSFSEDNIWQTYIHQKTGLRFNTYNYGTCIPNFVKTATSDISSKVVIIETIERDFVSRFSNIKPCTAYTPKALEIKEKRITSKRPHWPLTLNIYYLARTAINSMLLSRFPQKTFTDNNVVNTPLVVNCAKFSNRRHDRLLYFQEDDLKKSWSDQDKSNAISNILTMQRAVEKAGKKFLFVLIPDKSSVYAACIPERNISQHMINTSYLLPAAGVHSPNLLEIFNSKNHVIEDLYNPNNTHWSLSGYQQASFVIQRYLD